MVHDCERGGGLVRVRDGRLRGDGIYRIQSRWFPLSREAFKATLYGFLGLYKALVLVFNLVPFVALLIVG